MQFESAAVVIGEFLDVAEEVEVGTDTQWTEVKNIQANLHSTLADRDCDFNRKTVNGILSLMQQDGKLK